MTKCVSNSHIQFPRLVKITTYLSVIAAVLILLAKIYGWINTSSVALFGSLLDSLLDISASVINLLVMRIVLLPPDDNHRFGHDKMQDLAIFAQSLLFFCSSGLAIFSCIRRLIYYHPITNSELGIDVMIFSIIVTFFLVGYQTYAYKKTKCDIIAADKLHYFVDLLTNIAVIISIQLSKYWWFADPIFGIIIAMYLLYGSCSLFKQAIKNLIDHEFDKADKQKILDLISRYKEVLGVHDLKTRYAGNKPFVQCHLEMDGNILLFEAHRISELIQKDIEEEFPGCEIIIHQDPAGYEEDIMYPEKINVRRS